MPKIIEAVYENGVFKPLQKVDLKEGEKVRLKLESAEDIVRDAFGILKGKNTLKALKELENEFVQNNYFRASKNSFLLISASFSIPRSVPGFSSG